MPYVIFILTLYDVSTGNQKNCERSYTTRDIPRVPAHRPRSRPSEKTWPTTTGLWILLWCVLIIYMIK